MKSSDEIAREVIRSIVEPLAEQLDKSGSAPRFRNTMIESLAGLDLADLELIHFIEYVKKTVLAMKLAFRTDRIASWEIVGDFIRQLEHIASFSQRYNKRVDEVAARLKSDGRFDNSADVRERIEKIMDAAATLKEEIEEDYTVRMKAVSRKRRHKK